ncbi:hypothetical protein L6452_16724 [Arctium lappa]|uniref:Uncharacterized protein n=1 Tax=Arctium lappa TaxID=4217 RepID=A0ACB9C1I7_ARCLA|nr:hypothetical protein L6452_16724 [Arctium lappa]
MFFIDLLHRFASSIFYTTSGSHLHRHRFSSQDVLHRFASAQDVLHRSASDQDVLHQYASSICFIDFLSSARFCLRSVSSICFIDVLHRSSSMMLLLMISPLLLSRSVVAKQPPTQLTRSNIRRPNCCPEAAERLKIPATAQTTQNIPDPKIAGPNSRVVIKAGNQKILNPLFYLLPPHAHRQFSTSFSLYILFMWVFAC